MYKSYSYKDMPVPVKARHEEPPKKKDKGAAKGQEISTDVRKTDIEKAEAKQEKQDGILSDIKTDDILLIAIVLILLTDGCDDKILLAAIAYIFLSEII